MLRKPKLIKQNPVKSMNYVFIVDKQKKDEQLCLESWKFYLPLKVLYERLITHATNLLTFIKMKVLHKLALFAHLQDLRKAGLQLHIGLRD